MVLVDVDGRAFIAGVVAGGVYAELSKITWEFPSRCYWREHWGLERYGRIMWNMANRFKLLRGTGY